MLKRWLDKIDGRLCTMGILKTASWSDVLAAKEPRLYAGHIDRNIRQFSTHYGVTPFVSSSRNIRHDMRDPLPIPANSIATFQSEDVFEHIAYSSVGRIFDEIFRVLKPGGLFRFSVPDYRCPMLVHRSVKDSGGTIVFDPVGGGRFENGQVVDGGHLWFPVYETVKALFDASPFNDVQFLHYTDASNRSVLTTIDYTLGYVSRTPDHDARVASPRVALSIVVDARK